MLRYNDNFPLRNMEDRNDLFQKRRRKVIAHSKNRIAMTIVFCLMICVILIIKLIQYGITKPEHPVSSMNIEDYGISRPDIIDRNGEILATDILTFSLYVEPHKIISVDEIIEKLKIVLPDLDSQMIRRRLLSKTKFQWLRRKLSPQQQKKILALGLPGLGFRTEKRRFYPAASHTLHVVGYVDVDNRGISGIEKFLDMQGLTSNSTINKGIKDLPPIRLSLDLRVQNIVHQALLENKKKYNAESAGTVILNVSTGEIIAMVSVPDHDPHEVLTENQEGWLNRISYGTFEMGSIFKAFTIAMGIDSGLFTIKDSLDTRHPIREGKFVINDFHPQKRILTIPEIFRYSSNIGAAKIAEAVGIQEHKDFLHKLGLLSKIETELPEVKEPSHPSQWKRVHSLTISFGHGLSTTPLQTAVAAASLVNGGQLVLPTFMVRNHEEANKISRTVLKKSTVKIMRYLLREGVTSGSGRRAFVEGFEVGGKTGTAQKVIKKRYSEKLNFNSFLAVFPINDPQYVVLSFMDSPTIKENNQLTAGINVAPMVGKIIRRSASMLGVKPVFLK
ncbi:penicillin-binding protein 2 [Candidatus Liberibacter africanus]|uniref:Penicillin-binding transmembrane protein n=1 Tax=Candidatus Liberibacter africanus PTSAPSY TaxID=1277257 RepID=A0A0G3I427_LIBAF|nr:penicillin-binding protein 2 [Candidatus Liberibacter africanus]AKK20644.1 penicillin-binding transmembrane protein [Candidatus Liberibacter africanus PTSAPSY]QTP64321.1 penicillin-binding protein 2 [Candidatus Liberibacter africanus]